jgi:aldehyde dehydrogenase (NAD+)
MSIFPPGNASDEPERLPAAGVETGGPVTVEKHIEAVVAHLRDGADSRLAHTRRFRASQLKALERMIDSHRQDFIDALATDLGKSALEAGLTELDQVRGEIDHAQLYLSEWMEAKHVRVPLALQPAVAKVEPQPLGLVLIIGPWNYPVLLLLAPLVAAIASGNCAVLKPSELAPACSGLLARLLPLFLDQRAYALVEGGLEASKALLGQRWDHIFYTGGERGGRAVAEAAARQLIPTTLELGGKSPAVVIDGNHASVARRIAFGKFMNAGQTCTAPDYLLTVGSSGESVLKHLAKAVTSFYGKDAAKSRDYGRIVDQNHFDRLVSYLDEGTVAHGGGFDPETRFIEPTILVDVAPESLVMREEIFGPILPVIQVNSFDEAVRFINARPTPLAAYLFSENPRLQSAFEDQVRAGAIGHNICNAHAAVPGLPFGGVGASGMGSYHGRHGFERLSQMRPVLSKTAVIDTLQAVYPPYNWAKTKIIGRLM